jgi:GNAT superfamily N-acetyltransferase
MVEKTRDLEPVVAPAQGEEFYAAADLRATMAEEMGDGWDERYPGWRERFVEYFQARQSAGQSQIICARVDGNIVGMAAVSLVDDYHGHVRGCKAGRVNAVYVKKPYRRQGVARSIMYAAIRWLKRNGCSVARLNSSKEGVPLYESLGFQPRREMELHLDTIQETVT